MSQRFQVRASLIKGQKFYCRAGRGWTDQWTEVTVLDQDDDPMITNPVKNLPAAPDPANIGRKSFVVLSKDSRIVIKPVDGEIADVMQLPALASRVAALESELARSKADIEATTLRAKVAEGLRDSKQARITELEALLSASEKERADSRKAELDVIAEVKRGYETKLSELEGLLADATKPSDNKPPKKNQPQLKV
jgi:hypothetical protein